MLRIENKIGYYRRLKSAVFNSDITENEFLIDMARQNTKIYQLFPLSPTMKKSFFVITAIIFILIAVLHGIRIINQWPAQIGSLVIPIWASGIAFVITLLLSVWAFKLLAHDKK